MPRRAGKSDAAVVAKTHAALDDIADLNATALQSKAGGTGESRLPGPVRFPLAVVISFALAGVGYSLLGEVSKGDLAAVSRSQDTWVEVGILVGWRMIELGLGWFGGLDSLDVAMMALLAHGPSLYLLTTFYLLSPITAVSAVSIDVLALAIPFYLLRPLSPVHRPSAEVANRELVDMSLQLYTTALSAGIYSVIIVLAMRFFLPQILVIHFRGLPTLEPAYSASYATVLPVTLAFGAAASTFIFAPFATTGQAKSDEEVRAFDPSNASLGETVWWNIWGYTAKSKVVIRRTALTMFVTAVNTYLACTMTIYGIGSAGAASYAGVWAFAALCTGVGLWVVGED